MTDDRFERPVDPRVSPYLRRPLRTLKKAEQDNDSSGRHLMAVHSVELEPPGDIEPNPAASRSALSLRPNKGKASKKQP